MKLMPGHTALPCCEGVPEPTPASCCSGPRELHRPGTMLQQPCIQPCLLSLLKESLWSPQTWPMISSYMGLLMDAVPLTALPSCSSAVLLSERAQPCLCSALQQTIKPSSSGLDQSSLTVGFCCSLENRYINQEFFPNKFVSSIRKLGTNLCWLEFWETFLMLLSFKGREDFYTSLIKN